MIKLKNKIDLHPNMKDWARSFGQSVDYKAGILAIGSDDTPVDQFGNCGTVHLFRRLSERWEPTQILSHPEPLHDAFYGWSVSVDPLGRRIAVGADDHDGVGSCAGAVYIYEKNGKIFDLVQNLYPKDKYTDHAYFGFSVDIYGDELIIGAPSYQSKATDILKGRASPAVYFYIQRDGKYELMDIATMAWPFFGGNVRITKNGYIATCHKNGNGEIWVYDKKFIPQQIIKAPYKACGFGKSISVFDDWLLVGAPLTEYGGSAYLYGFVSGKYRLITEIFHIPTSGSCFGYDVSVCEKYFAVTDPHCRNHMQFENYCGGIGGIKGTIYIFDIENYDLITQFESESPVGGHVIHVDNQYIFEGNPSANHSQGEVNIYDYSEF